MKAVSVKSSRGNQNRENNNRVSDRRSRQGVSSGTPGANAFQFIDNRPEALAHRKLRAMMDNSPQAKQMKAIQEMVNNSPQAKKQAQLQSMIDHSPYMATQRQKMEQMFGQPVQRQTGLEEEELQMKAQAAPLQRQGLEEEELQMKAQATSLQRQGLEEEEELQMKAQAAPIQRQGLEEEEELQGKFGTAQRQSPGEEEPLQDVFAANGTPAQRKSAPDQPDNKTGLPDDLKAGIENLSGMAMDDVNVHYNSSKPAAVQALAYTQGTDIQVGPGQERHLAHEAWHVVQQNRGRVKPTMEMAGTPINDDASLEREADVMGARAQQVGEARQRSRIEVGRIAQSNERTLALQQQQKPVVQMIPAALAGLGAWLTAKTTVDAAGVVAAISAIGATGFSVGTAIMAGQTGVQEIQLPNNWMSRRDKAGLEQIIQYRLINAFVNHWNMNYVVDRIRSGRQQTPPSNPSGSVSNALNQTILDAVKTQVKIQIQTDLNNNTKHQTADRIFSWADSGDWSTTGVVDEYGTVGAVQFVDMAASELDEELRLSFSARQIPGLALSAQGGRRIVRQTRGGRFRRHIGMKRGLFDELGINIVGGSPTIHEDGMGGHGLHVYDTAWNWDNNTTRWVFDMYVIDKGKPWVSARHPLGEPAD